MPQVLLNIKKVSSFYIKTLFSLTLNPRAYAIIPLLGIICGILIENNYHFSANNLAILFLVYLIHQFAVLFLMRFKLSVKNKTLNIILLSVLAGIYSLKINQYLIFSPINKPILEKGLQAKVINKTINNGSLIKESLILKTLPQKNSKIKKSTKVICYLQKQTKIEPDDQIRLNSIEVKPAPIKENLSKNTNYQDYLKKEKISGIIFAKNQQPKLIYRPKLSIKRWFQQRRISIIKSMQNKLSISSLSLFSCLFLGNKNQFYIKTQRHLFNYWGISHFLARSGIHVALLIIIWRLLLGLLPLPFLLKHIALLVLGLLYCLLSWPSISFLRAIIVFFIYETGKIFNKQTNFIHALSLTCIITLLINPMHLFFLDFQLSYSLTFALALCMKQTKQ